MSHVGAQLGQVVERARTQDELSEAHRGLNHSVRELESRNQQAAKLSQSGDLLQSCSTLLEASEVIAISAARLLTGASGAVLVHSSSRHILEIAAHWGPHSRGEKTFSPADCWGLRRGRLHISDDHSGPVRCTHYGTEARGASLCKPLMAQGETLGVLCLVTEPNAKGEPGVFPDSTVKLAESVAEQAALALANLKLREKLRHQSIRDPLTGLCNRRYLDEALERKLPRAVRKNRPPGRHYD